MQPSLTFALVQHGFLMFFGVWMTLLGYRIVGHKPGQNFKSDEWYARNGWLLRVLGPIVAVGNFVMALVRYYRWQD